MFLDYPFIAMAPSLGFLGTVIGMVMALIKFSKLEILVLQLWLLV